MSAHDSLEARLANYYDQQVHLRAPDRLLASIASAVETTPQRRFGAALRRSFTVSNFARLAAAVVLIVVAAVAVAVWTNNSGRIGTPTSPTPSPTRSTAPAATPSAAATESPQVATPSPTGEPTLPPLSQHFVSTLNGISIAYPTGWQTRAATTAWTVGVPLFSSTFNDLIFDNAEPDAKFIGLASQPIGSLSATQWMDQLSADPRWTPTCTPAVEPVTVDGSTGRLVDYCANGLMVAFVVADDRGYAIEFYGVGDKAAFLSILATVQLDPAAAVDPTATP